MENYSYPYSRKFLSSKYIQYINNKTKFNRNKSEIKNNKNNISYNNISNLNSFKMESSPKSIKSPLKNKNNSLCNSPLSAKTYNIFSPNIRNSNILKEHNSDFHKNILEKISSKQEILNNSLYTTNSRMYNTSKTFYPSSKNRYMNNLNNK